MSAAEASNPAISPDLLNPPDSRAVFEESTKSAVRARRNETIDVIRLLSAAGIVYIHAARSAELDDSRNFFRFAVPFFLFASLYYQVLSLRNHPQRSASQYVAQRFKRLYLPFLAWSLIYLVARNAKRMALLHIGPARLEPGVLWQGTEYHLWFLPFLLAFSIVLLGMYRAIEHRGALWRWAAISFAIVMGFVFALAPMPGGWNEVFDNPTYAYVQFWRSLPAACWAVAFCLFMAMGRPIYSVSPILSVAGILLALACSMLQVFDGILLIPRALCGLGLMLGALGPWKWPSGSLLARLGRYGYGIYLCHVLIGELIRAVAAVGHFSPSVTLDLLIFGFSFAGSVLFAVVIGNSRTLCWLNG